MKILMITSEIAPYAKVGGLGDVVGALALELFRRGHDVRVVCPFYGFMERESGWFEYERPLEVNLGKKEVCEVWEGKVLNTDLYLYFLKNERYFGGDVVYYHDFDGGHQKNIERFTFLSRGGIDLCSYLDWFPDVIHCHDWMTGLVPVYLKTVERENRIGRIPSVLTIHNMYHQGIAGRWVLDFAGLPQELFVSEALEFMGNVNILKGGLIYATQLTTVSEQYAREIIETDRGCGLNFVIRARKDDLVGILNGIDTIDWNPAKDPYIPKNFDVDDMEGKRVCKGCLQKYFNIKEDPEVVLFGAIARLYPQKGLDLLLEVIPELVKKEKLQMVILGAGDSELEEAFKNLSVKYSHQVGVSIGYNIELAHLIEAGLDYFLMPSRFEPCGLNQMYSMVYGAVPIVHKTGGLVDTVVPYDCGNKDATGFMLDEVSSKFLYKLMEDACDVFYNKKSEYRSIQINGMKKDFSWTRSVKKYERVYEEAIRKKET